VVKGLKPKLEYYGTSTKKSKTRRHQITIQVVTLKFISCRSIWIKKKTKKKTKKKKNLYSMGKTNNLWEDALKHHINFGPIFSCMAVLERI
jgi:hypothetical protein